jgi:TolB protein
VYSLRDKLWKVFGNFCPDEVNSVALSPDGTKVAFTSKSRSGSHHCFDNPTLLQILDIATGEFTAIPYRAESLMSDSPLGWSPDGRYLVGQLGSMETSTQQIVLIEIASGLGKTIASGSAPSWSPKGNWIAYIADGAGGQKCMLIRPDGTDARMVHTLAKDSGGYSILYRGALWSPDGGKLLFNEMKADDPSVRVTMLNLATGRVITEPSDGLIVLGWGRESNHR